MLESTQITENFSVKSTIVEIIENFSKGFDTKIAIGTVTISPKLIKMASEFLAPFLLIPFLLILKRI